MARDVSAYLQDVLDACNSIEDVMSGVSLAVTARKDDAPAADQAAITNVVGWMVFSGGGGLIQTTSG